MKAEADDAGQVESSDGLEVATFGAGCFWCTEAVYEKLDGVRDVVSGYMGGGAASASYEEVSTGASGHAEVVQVTFDPRRIDYATLLDWFWKMHDPTTPNRQGADVGSQYRSVVFYHSDAQRLAAEAAKTRLAASGTFRHPIVTEIVPASTFHAAEGYHQDYFRRNPSAGYSQYIRGKLKKLDMP